MNNIIDTSTTGLVSLALDAAVLRQQALAQNIANANTPGYRPLRVSFEARVQELVAADGLVEAPDAGRRPQFRPILELAEEGAQVALDTEVAKLADNTLHHQVLLKALSKHLALIGTAINEGKR